MQKAVCAILLAAGEGKRMHSAVPKVLHKVCSKSMVNHAISAVEGLTEHSPVVVIGHGADTVRAHIGESVRYALQKEQRGTGHALMCAREHFEKERGKILVLAADMPLLDEQSVSKLLSSTADASMLTACADDPTGYGRIIRDESGFVSSIVEHKDASEEQRSIDEVNLSAYCFDIESLLGCLDRLTADNAQGEYYLTDCIKLLNDAGKRVEAMQIPFYKGMGVNSKVELTACTRIMQSAINERHMLNGITLIDPNATYIGADVKIDADTTVYPGVVLEGNTSIGCSTTLYPGCRIVNSRIGDNCALQAVVANEAIVENGINIGPFVNLRPGTHLHDRVKVGNFVEVKNSTVGEGSKLPHLSYIGDGTIGKRTNCGCGTVFVNYDGKNKHLTQVGDDVFLGCQTALVAPVSVGNGAYTAAGSVITEDVPDHAFAIARSRQTTKEGFAHTIRERIGLELP